MTWRTMLPAVLGLGIAGLGAARISATPPPAQMRTVAGYATSLKGRTDGQRYNAMLAAQRLNGKEIPAGGEFSFNRAVGTWSRDRGYVKAPVSYNGVLVADFGGGVCQTSTTLYNAALLAGFKVAERHRHRYAPSYVPPGRDAAVAYSAVDLRFQNPYSFPLRISSRVVGDSLIIELRSTRALPVTPRIEETVGRVTAAGQVILDRGGDSRSIRNSGRDGYDVQVWRIWPNRRELISSDSYPNMQRVIELR